MSKHAQSSSSDTGRHQRAVPAETGFLKFAAGRKQLVAELGFQFILTVGKGFGESNVEYFLNIISKQWIQRKAGGYAEIGKAQRFARSGGEDSDQKRSGTPKIN